MSEIAREIEIARETRVVEGIRLPYEKKKFAGVGRGWVTVGTDEVFIDQSDLYAVAEQDQWAGAFGNSLILTPSSAVDALVQHELAVKETRGGVHGTSALKDLIKRLWGEEL